MGISTSGNSSNVTRAVEQARERGLTTVAFTGSEGRLNNLADYVVAVPSTNTPRIQEGHTTIGHIVCGLVEEFVRGRDLDPHVRTGGPAIFQEDEDQLGTH